MSITGLQIKDLQKLCIKMHSLRNQVALCASFVDILSAKSAKGRLWSVSYKAKAEKINN